MKRVSDTTISQQPIAKRCKRETAHLQLSPELTVTMLGSNNCLHVWYLWIRTCRRNHDLALTRPARAHLMYPIDSHVATAIYSDKLERRHISQMRGTWVTPPDMFLIAEAFRSLTYLDLTTKWDPTAISLMSNLTQLSLTSYVPGPRLDLRWLGSLTRLRRLKLAYLPVDTILNAITRITSLEHLELEYVRWDPSIWSSLTGLTTLSLAQIEYPDDQKSITSLNCLENLVELTLDIGVNDSNISTLPDFACFPNLQFLELNNFDVLSSLAGLDQCIDLRTLRMYNCHAIITDFHLLSTLPRLTKIELREVGHLQNFPHLVFPPAIRNILIIGMDIYDLAIFADLPCLESLVLLLPTSPYHMSQPPTVWASPRLTDPEIVRLPFFS